MTRPILHRQVHRDGIDPPRDYAEPITFIPSRNAPRFGERLVLFFQLNGEALTFWFALFAIALLVGAVVGAYVGIGR